MSQSAPAKYEELIFWQHPITNGANRITTHFGEWLTLFGRAPYQHRGIDYGAYYEPVKATIGGKARYLPMDTGGMPSYGNSIIIETEYGDGHKVWTNFAHLSTFLTDDPYIEPGDLIAISGETGVGTAAHLHSQCSLNPYFTVDILDSIDQLIYTLTEADMKLIQDMQQQLSVQGSQIARLEALLGGNGVVVPPDCSINPDFTINGKLTTGKDAMEWMQSESFSLHLALAMQNQVNMNQNAEIDVMEAAKKALIGT